MFLAEEGKKCVGAMLKSWYMLHYRLDFDDGDEN